MRTTPEHASGVRRPDPPDEGLTGISYRMASKEKHRMKSYTYGILGTCLLLAGCGTADTSEDDPTTTNEVQQELGEATNSISNFASQKKDKVVAEYEEQMDNLDAKMKDLKARGSELKDDAKQEWEEQVAELEKKRQAAGERMEELKDSSGEAWEEVKSGFDAAWDDLKESMEDASSAISNS